ncbi:unnamed protein product [Agarophyton chilense]|eukprot:gb/GEZJ01002854.1/.p1 GENE.gb/GEZJ01002854.1/~~gb/GEZJ01002854.1/.p1  ORF type:complete len:1256 (-),score=171.54 gb/GEZJ01002854.1/:264-4031(-)
MVSVLGENLGFISGVYVTVLIPWTLLYTLDFISNKWICIGVTELKGWVHLIVITMPISYIVAYIVLQTQLPEPDYKEMYAAVAALVLSAYHLARTVWGLRQLVYLKRWVRETLVTMQAASYECALDQEMRTERKSYIRCGQGCFNLVPLLRKIFSAPCQDRATFPSSEVSSPDKMVKCMLLNNSLIDNEFNAGIADHVKLASWSRILFLPLKPSKPMLTFTRWATAFIAQFGDDWLKDAYVGEEDENQWIRKRKNYGLRVLTTAVLQMDPLESHAYLYGERVSRPISKKEKSFLPPSAWEKMSRRKDPSHVFSPDKILATFFSHRHGLPYSWQALSKGKEVPTRSRLRPLLKEAINGLRPKMQERLESFGPEHLELFAIFLWVQKNARDIRPRDNAQFRIEEKHSASEASYEFLQRQLGLDEDDRALNSLKYPFCKHGRSRHLWYNRNVLEVSCRVDNWLALSSGEQLCSLESFPTVSELDLGNSRGGERNASDKNSSYTSTKSNNSQHTHLRKNSALQDIPALFAEKDDITGATKLSKEDKSYKHNKKLEQKRLRFQLANGEARYNHAVQSLTFMGCVMESLRSGLGEQMFTGQISEAKDRKKRELSWVACVPDDSIEFPVSHELWKCLCNQKHEESLHFSIQERMLWECQVGTHHLFQGVLREPDAHRNVASMILFILGFPSLTIRRRRDGESNAASGLKYTIQATVPPQPIQVCVSVEDYKGNHKAKLYLLEENPLETKKMFHWHLWRDAFLGRLKAKAKWQKSHGMAQVHMNAKWENSLSKSVAPALLGDKKQKSRGRTKLMYWEGWPPFREGLAIFEQKCSLVGRNASSSSASSSVTEVDESKVQGRIAEMQSASKNYAELSDAVLSNSISYIDTALELRPSVIWGKLKNQEERQEAQIGSTETGKSNVGKWNLFEDLGPFFWHSSREDKPKIPENKSLQKVVDDTFRDAQAMNPSSMFKVAKWVLKGEEGFGQNRDQALNIMENAFFIGKDVEIALFFVKTCIEEASLYENRKVDYMDRAFSIVNLSWFNVENRLLRMAEEGNMSGKVEAETERVDTIINMNGMLVKEKQTSATLEEFADRLTMWFHVKGETHLRDQAIRHYESSVIADGNIFAMLKLGLLNATIEEEDSLKVALRTYGTVKERLKNIAFATEGIKGNRFDFKHVSVQEYTLHDVDKYLLFEMEQGHPGVRNLAKAMKRYGRPEEQEVARQILDWSCSSSVCGEGNLYFTTKQDHTVVNLADLDSMRES